MTEMAEKVRAALDSASIKTGAFTPSSFWPEIKRFRDQTEFKDACETADRFRSTVPPDDALTRVLVKQLFQTLDAGQKAFERHQTAERTAASARFELDQIESELSAILDAINK